MNRISSTLISHPIQQFRRDRRFYLRYDSFWFAVCALAIGAMLATRFDPLFGKPSLSWLLAFPTLLYGLIAAHLCMHNATHGNFPRRINRVLGELLGLFVVVRYASWDIVHMRHHKYSDDCETDPQIPTSGASGRRSRTTIVNVEVRSCSASTSRPGGTRRRTAHSRDFAPGSATARTSSCSPRG